MGSHELFQRKTRHGVETRVALRCANSISARIDDEKNGDLDYRSKFCGCCAALSETSPKGRCSVHGSSKFCEAHSGEEKGEKEET